MSEKKASVAIIGTGFMGLALAYWMQKLSITCDLYSDPQCPGASAIATGLLHLFHGQEARVPMLGEPALEKTLELMHSLDDSSFLKSLPILRPARNAKQINIFKKRARQFPHLLNFGSHLCNGHIYSNSLLIHKAWSVDCAAYLQALKVHLAKCNHSLIEKKIIHLNELDGYDKIFICSGAQLFDLVPDLTLLLSDYSLTKGQLATLSEPKCTMPSLEMAINARSYIVPYQPQPYSSPSSQTLVPVPQQMIVGASFEREFTSPYPASCTWRDKMMQEAKELMPSLDHYQKVHWKSALRLSGPEYYPFCAQQEKRLFVLGGLGSKGLLYHSWLAHRVAYSLDQFSPNPHWQVYPLSRLVN